MASIVRSGTWDEASSPAATRLARRFEDAWRDPRRKPENRPDPAAFLPVEDGGDSSPAARLALLRADLNLRWDEGEAVRVEEYRHRFPSLDADSVVALCYEEFCRREEDGLSPFPSEYDERFPDLADRLRRVFDIHELVGNAASTDLHAPGPELIPFPEAQQTIAGFHLVEELGRGSFARVFLAQERQLADRPVALKVARTGSREPQTLARLQHTHIVPVHSYRTDPATGLHLLCMPFFGRVTLARLLAEPGAKVAPTGRELLAALDRLEGRPGIASTTRATLAALPFARAIAWWGSRLADALAHAHDRGVLHRDIKPSNVLVTADGLPMLLDFNLAGEAWADRQDLEPDRLGGTLAYMAPEHLEAVSKGSDDGLDARADVFSLGVLLFEALTGTRPFPAPSGSSVPEALLRAAEVRRRETPRLRETHPEIPAAMERVIRRCLESDLSVRYPNANELAADLQAVSDDAPLKWTREPIVVRAVRRARRSWKRALLVAVVAGSGVGLASLAYREEGDRARTALTATRLLDEGRQMLAREDFATASARFDEVCRLTVGRPELSSILGKARMSLGEARLTAEIRREADAMARRIADLRFRLIGPEARTEPVETELQACLAPFPVLSQENWTRRPELTLLDPARRLRLSRDVDEILFLYASAFDVRDGQSVRKGVAICDKALTFAGDRRAWQALRNWLDDSPLRSIPADPRLETSARICFEWGVLLDRQGRKSEARNWLERAVRLDEANPWYHAHFAAFLSRTGEAQAALGEIGAAIALEPENLRHLRERAKAYRAIGDWARALEVEKSTDEPAPAPASNP